MKKTNLKSGAKNSMKLHKWLRLAVVSLSVLMLISACSTSEPKKEETIVNPDGAKFAAEYASFNGQTNDSGKKYLDVNLGDDNVFRYSTLPEVNDLIRSGSGIILFGFPQCPWCRNAIPVLNDVANEELVKEILYVNMLELRDTKVLDASGKVVTEKEGAEGYAELLELLGEHADEYSGLNDQTIKRVYVPAVIFVKDGVIQLYHVSTVESQEDPYVPLTDAQYKELYDIYAEGAINVREACTTGKEAC